MNPAGFFLCLFALSWHFGLWQWAREWQQTSQEFVRLRLGVLVSPCEVWRHWCQNKPVVRGEGLVGTPCGMEVYWYQGGERQPLCTAVNPRFPPRYYELELVCPLRVGGKVLFTKTIKWSLKR